MAYQYDNYDDGLDIPEDLLSVKWRNPANIDFRHQVELHTNATLHITINPKYQDTYQSFHDKLNTTRQVRHITERAKDNKWTEGGTANIPSYAPPYRK